MEKILKTNNQTPTNINQNLILNNRNHLKIDAIKEIIRSNDRNPEETMEFSQLKHKVGDLLKTLPPREKEFIEQRFFKDKKLRELSEEYQISPSRISRIIQSGLNRIKKELVKQEML